jgi:vesicle transport through interaction with t-SNAREs protein 1
MFSDAQVKEYKADLASLKEQLKQAAAGASVGDEARAELGLGDNYYSTSGAADTMVQYV